MLSNVVIRFARAADATDIARLSRDRIECDLPWQWTVERVRRAIRDRNTNVVVIGELGAVAAFGIMCYADDDAHLLLLAVRPSHQRRRLGSTIVQWLEQVAQAAGAQRVSVECRLRNHAARQFYYELGYAELRVVRGMYCGIEDGVRLQKCIGGVAVQ